MGKTLGLLNKLGCWLARQASATSLALTGLLTNVDSIIHATFQNQAAVDILLLLHGRGCEDFEMCCVNLSDHSLSIHASIKALQDNVAKLKIVDGADWFNNILETLGSLDGSKI